MKSIALFLCLAAMSRMAYGQSDETLQIRAVREKNEYRWIQEYIPFLSIPNIASDSIQINKNAAYIFQMMKNRGIEHVQYLTADSKGTPPVVYGEVNIAGADSTLIFYAHYDGQPVDSTQWSKILSPFSPKLLNGSLENQASLIPFPDATGKYDPEWRIYARSASDDKAGIMAILAAYEAVKQAGYSFHYNLRFFFEGEEEAGSTHLYQIFQKYTNLLKSDLWVICDGPVHQSSKKMIAFGVRGDAHVEVTVYGPSRPLHSGHYGNWVPNPSLMLAKLLASMKDEKGRVTIPGFYDNITPLTPEEKKAIAETPSVDSQMKNELKFSNEEMTGLGLTESLMLPSLNINGMQGGNIGKKASNVIPTSASAVLDLRMVMGNEYTVQQQKVLNFIRKQGYHITQQEPTDAERKEFPKIAKVKLSEGYNAQRTSMSLPFAKKLIAAVKSTSREQLVLLPSMGGSVPLFVFEKYLNAHTLMVPIANHDNNQHAENENIRLQNLWNGIETLAAIMMMK